MASPSTSWLLHEDSDLGHFAGSEGRLDFSRFERERKPDLGAFLRRDPAGVKDDLDYVFSLFILSERRKQAGGTLSGGEQQMLPSAAPLHGPPQTAAALTEPLAGSCPIIIQQIFSIIQKVNENGTTVFFKLSKTPIRPRIANHGYVMEKRPHSHA